MTISCGWKTLLIATAVLAAGAGAATAAPSDPAFAAFERGQYLTALKEAEKAATRGEPEAHTLIGEIYSRGLGVARNYSKAATWYEKGAKLGDVNAQFALALLLTEGRGIGKDRVRAAKLFETAAERGMQPPSTIWPWSISTAACASRI